MSETIALLTEKIFRKGCADDAGMFLLSGPSCSSSCLKFTRMLHAPQFGSIDPKPPSTTLNPKPQP